MHFYITPGPCSNTQCSLDGVSLTDGTCFGDSIHHTCVCADGFELMEIQRFKDQPKSKVCAPSKENFSYYFFFLCVIL